MQGCIIQIYIYITLHFGVSSLIWNAQHWDNTGFDPVYIPM